MIPKECKRLAEVDFPIAEVSRHSAREKSIRHGHPSTLHLWWARRPLAACRAMLLALLLPDPCDPHCPEEFKTGARSILAPLPLALEPDDEGLRKALLRFIGDFANWDLSSHPLYLKAGRELVKAAHPEEPPLVVDPFAGGGSIPLEALRLGCEAFASDLNPVACIILKVMLEDIPRHGPKLAEELRRVGNEIKEAAEKELAEFYPIDPDGSRPIAYLWARTVRCESPHCGAEIPLVRSFWLSKKASRKRALRYKVVRSNGERPTVDFEVFEPEADKEVPSSTVFRAKATCVACGAVLPPERLRAQLAEQRGGADVIFDSKGQRTGGARMLAVVALKPGQQGRFYRVPTDNDHEAVWKAQIRLHEILQEWKHKGEKGLCPVPDEPIPLTEVRRISVPLYGCDCWDSLFSSRQKVALTLLANLARTRALASNLSPAMNRLLALSISKQAERLSSLVTWITQTDAPRGSFARQALGFVWDYCELVPVVEDQEYPQLLEAMGLVVEQMSSVRKGGQVEQADACEPVFLGACPTIQKVQEISSSRVCDKFVGRLDRFFICAII